MKAEVMRKAASIAVAGYIFVCIDVRIGVFDLLPNCVGYFLLTRAAEKISIEEKDSELLVPLGILLILLSLPASIASAAGVYLEEKMPILQLLMTITSLYFHYQLLTDFSRVAKSYESDGSTLDKKIVYARNIQTILTTAVYVYTTITATVTLPVFLLAIVVIFNCLVIIFCLLALRESIQKKVAQNII